VSGRSAGRSSGQALVARVNLLPPEIEGAKRASRARAGIVGLAITAVLLVVAAIGVTVVLAAAAQARLFGAQDETIQILQQQNEFIEVRTLAQQVETVKAAQLTGALTEIEMQALIRAVDATLPAGVLVSSFAIDSGSPIEDFPPTSSPLEQARVATLLMTAAIPNLEAIQQWVVSLKTLTGFADVFVSNVAREEETGSYEVIITVNFNSELYRGRFAPVDDTAAAGDQTDGTVEPTPTAPVTPEAEATE